MAVREIQARFVTWQCRQCSINSGEKKISTTQGAEEHADSSGHAVMATGMITYIIGQGTLETDDPFKSKNQ